MAVYVDGGTGDQTDDARRVPALGGRHPHALRAPLGRTGHDRQTKLPVYRAIESVSEILLIDSESVYAEILRRDGHRWITELVRGRDAILRLSSVELQIAMAELYEGIDVDADKAAD